MIAVDTNILVYAHRRDSEFHAAAASAIRGLAEGTATWAIPWPCIHEFHAIVTHPRVYDPPTKVARAVEQIDAWLASPSLALLGEASGYWPALRRLATSGKVAGARIHDARIAALCALHGVRELWTADRDFSRFPSLDVRNPLADA